MNKLYNNIDDKNDLELMFFNPITQNRFSSEEISHVQKIFVDSLIDMQTKPKPKNLKEKIIANASLYNLNQFSQLIGLASAFNPALGQVKGVQILLQTVQKLNEINQAYKDFSEIYKLYVSEKDSEISKKDKWLKTANHLLGLAGSARSAGLIKYKDIDFCFF